MDFRNVKSLTIPEGKVKKITSGGVVLWTANNEEPIWTWKLSDPVTSILDKKIEVPNGFDPTTWLVKLTLSVKLSEMSAGNGVVYYFDENSERQSMKIKENEKFTVTARISDTLNVEIPDKVTNNSGFVFYYDPNDICITTAFAIDYEPTEVTLWAAEFIKPELTSLVMVVDDLVAAGELTANGRPLGSNITLSNGITLYGKNICRTAANYNYGDKKYSAAIRIVSSGGMLLDITNYNTLTLIGRSSSATSPRNLRVGNQDSSNADTSSYTNYVDMKFHDPNAGDVTNAVTLAQYDLTTIKNNYGNVIKLWFSGNADICELRLD